MSSDLAELKTWLEATYQLEAPVQIKHLRSHTNETYLVQAVPAQYILKLYHDNWHTEDEILWEVDLLDHLASKGASVAQAVKAKDDSALTAYTQRRAILFEYASGSKPAEPFDAALYYHEGRSIAAVHQAADDFTSLHHRQALDITYLIAEPVAYILPKLADEADKQFLQDFAHELTTKITAFADKGLDYGPIHGDVTLDNFHVTSDNTITWYDFDSGGPGWRAYDLQGWALLENTPDFLQKRQAFLKGYQEVRELSENDLAASPYLHIASEIWGFSPELKRLAHEGDKTEADFLTERIKSLRERALQLKKMEEV